jgi:hypothetical protein
MNSDKIKSFTIALDLTKIAVANLTTVDSESAKNVVAFLTETYNGIKSLVENDILVKG